MGRQTRLLFGVSIFWLALSTLFDGINTLVLPLQVGLLASQTNQATILGLLTFVGLLAGALVQPVAGTFSDTLQPVLGRKGFIGIGLLLSLVSLFILATVQNLAGIMLGYLAVQISASIAQAGQQGLMPDLVDERRRGMASGLKGFMDLTGAMLGFVVLGQLLGSGKALTAIGAIAAILVIAYILAVLLTPEDKPNRQVAIKTDRVSLPGIFRFDLTEQKAFVRLILARFLFLLGVYGTGRFLLFFVAKRLGLSEDQAAAQAGNLLAGLALITVLASPLTGWLADRIGRVPLMIAGALCSAVSALTLVWANSASQILLFGGLMSLGSAAFAGGSWALLADVVPKQHSARFFGLANFSTAGAAAAAGLFGPVIDWGEQSSPGMGFSILFILASIAFITSALPLKELLLKEHGEINENKRKVRSHGGGLAVLSLSADPADVEKDQDSPGGSARL
ncbi:MAG TPA: MFS transporter [Anaerolineales bacterium]|nr:MFS transporter [Anaerolineales bacterium]